MLTIRKDSKAVKAFTAGCIAFAVGLTGAAAYTNSVIEHQNLVLNKEQTFQKKQTPSALTVSDTSDETSTGSGANNSPQQASQGNTTTSPTASTSSPQSSLTPGRGSGGSDMSVSTPITDTSSGSEAVVGSVTGGTVTQPVVEVTPAPDPIPCPTGTVLTGTICEAISTDIPLLP